MNTTYTFKVHSLRTLSSPYKNTGEKDAECIYYLLIDMRELPEGLPLDVNPREPKMTTNVARRIINAVVEPETDFYINNRGIVIAAQKVVFDSTNSEVTIDLGDQENDNDKYSYGILDGGHTYTAIMENRDKIPADLTKYVRVEVITNVQNITRLSDARNTSAQVSDVALFELDKNFNYIREAIKGQSYADKIAYKDNEDKPIHVSELVKLMFAFDILKYPDDNTAPIQSYSGKAQVFKRYKEAFDTPFYKSLTQYLPKLTELYDRIETDLPEMYNTYKKNTGVAKPKFGKVTGVEADESVKTLFYENAMTHRISVGYILPIFGAFRSLIRFDETDGKVSWVFDPIEIWEESGASLAQNVFESLNKNPQSAGKDKQLWLSCYRIVETQSLRKLLSKR